MNKIIMECNLNYYGYLTDFIPVPKLPYIGFISTEEYLVEGSHTITLIHSAHPLREHNQDFEIDFKVQE